MDRQTRDDMYTMAEWAATLDALDRLHERRARRHQALRFWFNLHQVAADPAGAVPTPGTPSVPPLSQSPGVGSGLAGSEPIPPPPVSPYLSAPVEVDSPRQPNLHGGKP